MAEYLQNPEMEDRHAITKMPLKPKEGTLILIKGREDDGTVENWRAHGYRWKQINGGKDVLNGNNADTL